jgi:predicted DCC family thiol-disulfide oxidoreductase YuxK
MTEATMDKPADLIVVYDGECPFCSNYVRLMSLRKAVGRVELVDARSGGAIVREIAAKGLDLDEGMVVRYGARDYFGADAVMLLSQLSDDSNPAARALSRLLANPNRARALYPFMKLGRDITLRLLGRSKIGAAAGAGFGSR